MRGHSACRRPWPVGQQLRQVVHCQRTAEDPHRPIGQGLSGTLLALGIKNIRLGPTLPAFLTPNLVQVLVDQFGLKPIGNAQDDIREAMGLQAA